MPRIISGFKVLLLVVTLFFPFVLRADPNEVFNHEPAVIGLRQNQDKVKAFAHNHQFEVLEANTQEFANGNTFVRIKGEITHRYVVVLIPQQMTPDSLMEALITVRTLKTNGAAWVDVVFEGAIHDTSIAYKDKSRLQLDLNFLFKTAGATRLTDTHGVIEKEKRYRRVNQFPRTSAEEIRSKNFSLLSDDMKTSLISGLASKLNLAYAKSVETLRKCENVLYILANPQNAEIFKAMETFFKLSRQKVPFHLITPYLPYARSDKIDQPGITVTGKLIADLFESVGTESVSFVRPHAPQSQGFFSIPSFVISSRPTINEFVRNESVEMIIAPDAGAQKDATQYADELGLPVGVINKARDPLSGKARLVDISGPDVAGKTVAIIDDETASGATLGLAAAFLKQRGAKKVIGIVTHLAGSPDGALNNEALDLLVVTDTLSVNIDHPKLRVLNISEEMSGVIRKFARVYPKFSEMTRVRFYPKL